MVMMKNENNMAQSYCTRVQGLTSKKIGLVMTKLVRIKFVINVNELGWECRNFGGFSIIILIRRSSAKCFYHVIYVRLRQYWSKYMYRLACICTEFILTWICVLLSRFPVKCQSTILRITLVFVPKSGLHDQFQTSISEGLAALKNFFPGYEN